LISYPWGRENLLVLSRKQHQSLVIGDDIKITVLELKGNQVRLGIDAPDSIVVHREEIHKKIT
jgi:carbon storage regulator